MKKNICFLLFIVCIYLLGTIDVRANGCQNNMENMARLKQISFISDISNNAINQLTNFDPNIFVYNGIKVSYEVSSLNIGAYVIDEGDSVIISGNEDLIVNDTREIKIKVTSKSCPNYSNVYLLYVTRQPKITLSSNADLQNIKIWNYEFAFTPEQSDYKIDLKDGDSSLLIETIPFDETTKCEISGNENLKNNSVIKISCVAADPEAMQSDYTITISEPNKYGTFIGIIIIIVLIGLGFLIFRKVYNKILLNSD